MLKKISPNTSPLFALGNIISGWFLHENIKTPLTSKVFYEAKVNQIFQENPPLLSGYYSLVTNLASPLNFLLIRKIIVCE